MGRENTYFLLCGGQKTTFLPIQARYLRTDKRPQAKLIPWWGQTWSRASFVRRQRRSSTPLKMQVKWLNVLPWSISLKQVEWICLRDWPLYLIADSRKGIFTAGFVHWNLQRKRDRSVDQKKRDYSGRHGMDFIPSWDSNKTVFFTYSQFHPLPPPLCLSLHKQPSVESLFLFLCRMGKCSFRTWRRSTSATWKIFLKLSGLVTVRPKENTASHGFALGRGNSMLLHGALPFSCAWPHGMEFLRVVVAIVCLVKSPPPNSLPRWHTPQFTTPLVWRFEKDTE